MLDPVNTNQNLDTGLYTNPTGTLIPICKLIVADYNYKVTHHVHVFYFLHMITEQKQIVDDIINRIIES